MEGLLLIFIKVFSMEFCPEEGTHTVQSGWALKSFNRLRKDSIGKLLS